MVATANILHQETIKRLSSDGAFARGLAYQRQGRVAELVKKDGSIHAKVNGNEVYVVRIWMKDESLAYSCSCPQGQDSAFCKHAVAVALTASAPPGKPRAAPEAEPRDAALPAKRTPLPRAEPGSVEPPEARPSAGATLSERVKRLSHDELVAIVLEQAVDDEAFHRKLSRRLGQ